MIYAARGLRRGERISLRNEDLDVLAGLVGNDADQVERRLIELMDCTPDEARTLRALLFRRRTVAAAAGLALGLTAMIGALDHAQHPSPTSSAGQAPVMLSPFESPTDDVPAHGEASSAVLERDGGPQHAPVPEGSPEASTAGDTLAPVVAVNDAPSAELIPALTLEVQVPDVPDVTEVTDVPVAEPPTSVVTPDPAVAPLLPDPPIADTMVGPDGSEVGSQIGQ
jgi:hypothetical protein